MVVLSFADDVDVCEGLISVKVKDDSLLGPVQAGADRGGGGHHGGALRLRSFFRFFPLVQIRVIEFDISILCRAHFSLFMKTGEPFLFENGNFKLKRFKK